MAHTMTGLFEHRDDAEAALLELLDIGIRRGELGLATDEQGRTLLRCRTPEPVAERAAAVLRRRGASIEEERREPPSPAGPRLGGEHPIGRGGVQLFSNRLVEEDEGARGEPPPTKREREPIPRTEVAVGTPASVQGAPSVDPFARELDGELRRSFPNTPFARTGTYEQWAPAYRYGYDLARRQGGRDFETFEPEARAGWERAYGVGSWADVRQAVRHAWEKVRAREERPSLGA